MNAKIKNYKEKVLRYQQAMDISPSKDKQRSP